MGLKAIFMGTNNLLKSVNPFFNNKAFSPFINYFHHVPCPLFKG